MPRFFVRSTQIEGQTVCIVGEDAHHISRSLRMAVGDEITVCDMQKNEYQCKLAAFFSDRVEATILQKRHTDTEPPISITLFQALPKGDKLDLVIQKSVECGVARIVPFESERCIVRIKPDAQAHKTERRNRIAAEAAKQCGRGCVPTVADAVTFSDMLCQAKQADLVLFCYEGDGTEPIGRILADTALRDLRSIALVVGGEGGFSLSEAERARAEGFCMTGLGKRILRTETAPIFALAAISCTIELS